jgi:hypothetical protein
MSKEFFHNLRFTLPISLIMWALFVLLVVSVTGCASLVPNYVAPELEHMSHATQHAPFTNSPTKYGANIASVVVGYNLPHNLNVELSDGVSLDRHYAQSNQWGDIEGPREQFSARIRYMIQVRK